MSLEKFIGEMVDVIPEDGDDFGEFRGTVVGIKHGFLIVVDQVEDYFNVYPRQITIVGTDVPRDQVPDKKLSIKYDGRDDKLSAKIFFEDHPDDDYNELYVDIYRDEEMIATVIVGSCEQKDLRVLISTKDNPEDPSIAVYPERDGKKIVNSEWDK